MVFYPVKNYRHSYISMHEEKYIKLSLNDLSSIIRQPVLDSLQPEHPNHLHGPHGTTLYPRTIFSHQTIMADGTLWQALLTFTTVMIVIFTTKPSCLFTNSHNPKFKPIIIGDGAGKITLCYFITIVAILCCCVVY